MNIWEKFLKERHRHRVLKVGWLWVCQWVEPIIIGLSRDDGSANYSSREKVVGLAC